MQVLVGICDPTTHEIKEEITSITSIFIIIVIDVEIMQNII